MSRIEEIGRAIAIIAVMRKNYLPDSKEERALLVTVWRNVLEEVPAEEIVNSTIAVLRNESWEPTPHAVLREYRAKHWPQLDLETATSKIIELALATSYADPLTTQKDNMVHLIGDTPSGAALVEVAFTMRDDIRQSRTDNRTTLRAQVRRAFEAARDRVVEGQRLALVERNKKAIAASNPTR